VYELELVAGPKVRLDNVEDIQVLTMLQYWLRSD
jgi:hypothetical protein